MGASFDYRIYETNDRKEAQAEWLEDKYEAEIEHINNCQDNDMSEEEIDEDMIYSGMINTLDDRINWKNVDPFDNEDSAVDYIEKNHEKWQPALGVPFKNGDQICYAVGGWCSD